MKTVPDTDFTVSIAEYQLVMNLLEAVVSGAKRDNKAAALRDILEAEHIIGTWPSDSLAAHMHKRITAARKLLEIKMGYASE